MEYNMDDKWGDVGPKQHHKINNHLYKEIKQDKMARKLTAVSEKNDI